MDIIMNNIYREYRGNPAIKNFCWNINLDKGLVYGLVGPNGAGKTTLLKVLAGIYMCMEGTIQLVGGDENYENWIKNNVSFIAAGERGLRARSNVLENVLIYGVYKGIDPMLIKENFNKYSRLMRIDRLAKKKIQSLSMGQQKAVSIVSALSSGNKLLILDEPSNGLDITAQVELQNIIKQIAQETKTTFIISSHDIDFLSNIADKYTFIFDGQNVASYDCLLSVSDIKNTFLELKCKYESK